MSWSSREPDQLQAQSYEPTLNAPRACEYPYGAVVGCAFFIVIANLVVDILYAVVDPRVRH